MLNVHRRTALFSTAGLTALLLGIAMLATASSHAQEHPWPQLQRDAQRTGHSPEAVKAPYRARWIWFGPDHVLRNRDSESGEIWVDELASVDGNSYRMPESVPFAFGGGMQPIVREGRVFVADIYGTVYALSLDDGGTLWTAKQPGGSMFSGVVTERQVVFASMYGFVTAWDPQSGEQLWQTDTGSSISHSPAFEDEAIYVANHAGELLRLDPESGSVVWRTSVGAPVHGGLCVSDGVVYLGNEAVEAMAVDTASGGILARQKVNGQTFRLTWPVAAGDRVIFSALALLHGAEYVNDPIFSGVEDPGWAPDLKSLHADTVEEQHAMRQWLASEEGRWHETVYALKKRTLEKDYIVACGAVEGCGMSPNPPAISADGRPILWFATAFPSIGRNRVFGSNFAAEPSYMNLESGLREPIPAKKSPHLRAEVDNMFGLTIGGHILYLRQNFRGTMALNLDTAKKSMISNTYRHRDGGTWKAAVNYAEGSRERGSKWPDELVRVPRVPGDDAEEFKGRVGPTIVDGRLLFTEYFAVTCVERDH